LVSGVGLAQDGTMSNFEQPAPGGDPAPGQRIGDPERQAAIQALDAHREAGRLSAEEYEERQVAVAAARTWADVQLLFTDLPAPYPEQMPIPRSIGGSTGQSPGQQLASTIQPQPVTQGLLGGIIPQAYRATVMALTPFVAVALFFLTDTWLWFLAIPIMGVLLYGPDGNHGADRQRNRRRHR
jgi:hypothetical protein